MLTTLAPKTASTIPAAGTVLLGSSAAIRAVQAMIRRIAPTDLTVLLAGETGTGKEVAARSIHAQSPRRAQPFVALNCGAVSASLVESELFGHEKGSFTGATRRHDGVFAQAAEGTLFLDEITEMPLELQVKLLRVLETGTFHRLGGESTVQTRARVIAATNRDPAAAVRQGRLREDLFYRLRVFPIHLPPLRDRLGDLTALALHFLHELNERHHTDKTLAPTLSAQMHEHAWPGNVRELKHFVQQAYVLADLELDAALQPSDGPSHELGGPVEVKVGSSIAAAEQLLICATLAHFHGDKPRVAKVLGISLKTLYCRLNVYEAAPIS